MIFGVAGWVAFGNEFKGKIKKSWWGLQCGITICDVAICRCGFSPEGRPSLGDVTGALEARALQG